MDAALLLLAIPFAVLAGIAIWAVLGRRRLVFAVAWLAATGLLSLAAVLTRNRGEAVSPWIGVSSELLNTGVVILLGALALGLVTRGRSVRGMEYALIAITVALLVVALASLIFVWTLLPPAGAVLALLAVAYGVWALLPPQRRTVYEGSWEIAAPPERVFAVATDPAAYEQVFAGEFRGEVVGGGPLAPGARIGQVARTGLRGEDEVLEYDPPRLLRTRALAVLGRAGSQVTCEPGAAGTLLRVRMEFEYPPPASLLMAPDRRSLARRRERWARAVAELAQAESPVSG